MGSLGWLHRVPYQLLDKIRARSTSPFMCMGWKVGFLASLALPGTATASRQASSHVRSMARRALGSRCQGCFRGCLKLASGRVAFRLLVPCIYTVVYGWLSKLWSLFGYPKYWGPYYDRDPKRDHNFDNLPYRYNCNLRFRD